MKQVLASAGRVAHRWLHKGASRGVPLRIYEYVDNKGIVFWSFTKLPISSFRRMEMVDVGGTHFRKHISEIHQMAFHREILDEVER